MSVSWTEDGVPVVTLSVRAVLGAAGESLGRAVHRVRARHWDLRMQRWCLEPLPEDGAPLAERELAIWRLARIRWDLEAGERVVAAEKLIERRARS
jgi:hypothetical protein